jgi:hypothetical protein
MLRIALWQMALGKHRAAHIAEGREAEVASHVARLPHMKIDRFNGHACIHQDRPVWVGRYIQRGYVRKVLESGSAPKYWLLWPVHVHGEWRMGVGAENRVTLCDLLVLVDESTETIAPKNVKTAAGF